MSRRVIRTDLASFGRKKESIAFPRALKAALALLLIVAAMMLPYFPAGTASAADIFVEGNSYLNDYPNQIRFFLNVNSTSEIRRVMLYYQFEPSPVLTYAFPQFQRGEKVSVEYTWNTQRRYIPPGVQMKYYWVIENAAGSRFKTEPQRFTVEDMRFKWKQTAKGNVTISWYRGDQNFADTLMSFTQVALTRLSQEAGIEMKDPVHIYIYASKADLLGALEPKAQEWTGGRAMPELGLIILNVDPDRSGLSWAERALPHELSHLVVGRVTENPYGDIPHWLDEGMAMRAEGDPTSEFTRSLDLAIRNNQLISIRSLASNFPTDSDDALLSYAESYSIVTFMLREFGREKMAELLSIFKEGVTYDEALQRSFGTDLDGLEEQWRASLDLPPLEVGSTSPTPGKDARAEEGKGGFCFGAGPALALGALGLVLGGRQWIG